MAIETCKFEYTYTTYVAIYASHHFDWWCAYKNPSGQFELHHSLTKISLDKNIATIMKLLVVAFGLLFALAYAQVNQANYNNGWSIVTVQATPLRSSPIDASNQAIVTEAETSDGRLFFNLLATTITTTSTTTSTCTVSTNVACSGKKRRSVLLWKGDGDELERYVKHLPLFSLLVCTCCGCSTSEMLPTPPSTARSR